MWDLQMITHWMSRWHDDMITQWQNDTQTCCHDATMKVASQTLDLMVYFCKWSDHPKCFGCHLHYKSLQADLTDTYIVVTKIIQKRHWPYCQEHEECGRYEVGDGDPVEEPNIRSSSSSILHHRHHRHPVTERACTGLETLDQFCHHQTMSRVWLVIKAPSGGHG